MKDQAGDGAVSHSGLPVVIPQPVVASSEDHGRWEAAVRGDHGSRGSGKQAVSSLPGPWELHASHVLLHGNAGLLFQGPWFLRVAVNPSDNSTFLKVNSISVDMCSGQRYVCQLEMAHWPSLCHFWTAKQNRATGLSCGLRDFTAPALGLGDCLDVGGWWLLEESGDPGRSLL